MKLFDIGRVVNVTGGKTPVAQKNMTILELHDHGFVAIQRGVRGQKPRFFSWAKVEDVEIEPTEAELKAFHTKEDLAVPAPKKK
jgi:ribosomal protein L14E/L6E/L27E